MATFETIPNEHGLNVLPAHPSRSADPSRPANSFRLLDFQFLKLPAGESFQGFTGSREVLAVILGGKAAVAAGGTMFPSVGGRPNVFSGKPHSIYLPCGTEYTFTALGPLEAALVSAPSELKADPYLVGPEKVAAGVWGAANFSRSYHQILTLASQPDLPAQRLIVGETYTPSGNWSTFPPHKHEQDDLPREAWHEELYYFKVNPPDGFGLTRCYDAGKGSGEGDIAYVVRDHTILMAPAGYHTVVSAPGYTTYYLWALAGTQRIQAVADDPAYAWVSRTVPMLKSYGL